MLFFGGAVVGGALLAYSQYGRFSKANRQVAEFSHGSGPARSSQPNGVSLGKTLELGAADLATDVAVFLLAALTIAFITFA